MRMTHIYPAHKEAGARFIEFAAWEMPVQYEGVRQEHCAVRESVGLFDVSHMGEIEITGQDAFRFCQYVTTNDLEKITEYQAQYTLFCNESGGVVDDVIIYKFPENKFLFCVNASNSKKDYEWLRSAGEGFNVDIIDKSSEYSQIAIQGPRSEAILSSTLGEDLSTLKRFRFRLLDWQGRELMVARTGYTGEDGFEIFLPWEGGLDLWRALMLNGKESNIKPCGLAARDTLRIEMGYSLYGHEIDEDINPLEAGLDRYIKMDKGDFIGRNALQKSLEGGLKNTLVGFEIVERGIPRQGYNICKNGVVLGKVTSGTMSPSLDKPIGIGFVKNDVQYDGKINIEIRSSERRAHVVDLPFYK